MNTRSLLFALTGAPLLALCLLPGAPASGDPAPMSSPVQNRKAVRAQYVDTVYGFEYRTTVRLTNTNMIDSIRLSEAYIFGYGGRGNILSTHTGLPGTVIEPLQTVEFVIDESIPGIELDDYATTSEVATFMVDWVGDPQALKLEAEIVHLRPSSQEDRSSTLELGFDVRM